MWLIIKPTSSRWASSRILFPPDPLSGSEPGSEAGSEAGSTASTLPRLSCQARSASGLTRDSTYSATSSSCPGQPINSLNSRWVLTTSLTSGSILFTDHSFP
jgi:hypothetical protein